jgi:hypothetical protein
MKSCILMLLSEYTVECGREWILLFGLGVGGDLAFRAFVHIFPFFLCSSYFFWKEKHLVSCPVPNLLHQMRKKD